jgi:hypothetical protein
MLKSGSVAPALKRKRGGLPEVGRLCVLGLGVVGVGFYFFDLIGVAFAVGGD